MRIQDTPEWQKECHGTIGASKAAAVLGVSPWSTPYQAWLELTGQAAPTFTSPAMLRGIMLEPVAIELLRRAGHEVEPHPQDKFLYSDDYPFAHVLPDAMCVWGYVEIKVPSPQVWGQMALRGIPEHYRVALQHAMAVQGYDAILFVALNPVTMELLTIMVEADDAEQQRIMDAERDFWERYVVPRVAPDMPPAMAAAIEDGPVPQLAGPEIEKMALEYMRADEAAMEAAALKDMAKDDLLAAAGNLDAFEVAGVGRFYNREQAGRRTFDSKAAIKEDPALERFMRAGKPFRVFKAFQIGGAK